ncbi:MAG: DNA replication/repair protein RecF [Clostridia bacterium]
MENFRNYEKEEVCLSPEINIIYGKNGAGKTNLIEALYSFSYARSFRAKQKEMIRHNCELTRLNLLYESEGRKQSAQIVFNKENKKKIWVNEINVSKTSDLLGRFICVLFTPDELGLVKDGPEKRRKFLDSSIVSLRPSYFSALSAYNICLKQKNAVLKSGNYVMLDIWNEKLSEYGAVIAHLRKSYVEKLAEKAKKAQFDISGGKEELSVIYSHAYKIGENKEETKGFILEKLEEAKKREIDYKISLAGPHRDDILFKINSFNAKNYGSQGQQRSIVLSMKTAQMEIIEEQQNEYPQLLLDDVLSELDGERRDYFTEKIKGKQVVISCTDLNNINIKDNANLIKIEDGRVCI